VYWLWALVGVGQVVLLVILVRKRYVRRLIFLSIYLASGLLGSACLFIVYRSYGFFSPIAFSVAWATNVFSIIAKALAVVEVFRLVLKPYRGIWAMAWRSLAAVAGAVVFWAVFDAGGSGRHVITRLERGAQLACAATLVSMLLLVRYYAVPVHAVYKALLSGFCFYCCGVVLINTILEQVSLPHSVYYQSIWNGAELLCSIATFTVWIIGLRHPLPIAEERPTPLPPFVCEEMTPLVQARLRLLNERLEEILHV
jgi:hypothetical protein